jgi:microcystin-dependent protein
MSDQFLAEVRIFPFNFAPTGWAFCDGQLLPLSQNTALFALLGTYYGGDGKSTFALPNMQGSAMMQSGQGQGLSERFQGEVGGSSSVTLLTSEIPAHTHTLNASSANATVADPTGNLLAKHRYTTGPTSGLGAAYSPNAPDVSMGFNALGVAGGSFPHNNMQPYLVLNFCIALQGVFPQRP